LPLEKSSLDLPEIEIDNDGFSLPAWLQLVPVAMAWNSKLSPSSIHNPYKPSYFTTNQAGYIPYSPTTSFKIVLTSQPSSTDP